MSKDATCVVTKKHGTFCVGDRVERTGIPKKLLLDLKKRGFLHGRIIAIETGHDNSGKPSKAARVRWDGDGSKDFLYKFLIPYELKKI